MPAAVTPSAPAIAPAQNAAAVQPTVVVFSHDLHDARFHKRLRMFADLGFAPRWLAFDRQRKTHSVNGILQQYPGRVVGKSQDAKYAARLAGLALASGKMLGNDTLPADTDIIYCINLDNLFVAIMAKMTRRLKCRIVYEVADIQPVLLKPGRAGKAIRAMERWCLKRTDLLVYTSEHFMSEFMRKEQHCTVPAVLLENKIYPAPDFGRQAANRQPAADGRLVVGLFGQLRCRTTMEMIRRLAAAFPDKIRFVLRGYPNHEIKDIFDGIVTGSPNIQYGGPYAYPNDLAALYASVDICWGFDFCSPGQNSQWCLTNRLYESGFFGVPILVEDGTAGGEFVRRLGSGWVLPHPLEASLQKFFGSLTAAEVRSLQAKTAAIDPGAFALEADLPNLRRTFLKLAVPQAA